MVNFSPRNALFSVLVPVLLASPSITPLAFAGTDAPAVGLSHTESRGEVGSAAIITALGALGLAFTFAGSHGHSDGVEAPAVPNIIASTTNQSPIVAPMVLASASSPIPLLWPSQTPTPTTDLPADGGAPTPGTSTFFLSSPPDMTPAGPGAGNTPSFSVTLTLPQDACQVQPLEPKVLFATPEPSTWTAFAFTALCVGGLMLCARRREAF